MAKDNNTTQKKWLTHLDDDIANGRHLASYDKDIDIIMKEYLLSSDASLAEGTALRMVNNYWETYIPSISTPPEKIEHDNEMMAFLGGKVYCLIFELGCKVPCGDIKQGMLLQLVLELRKLTPKIYKYRNQLENSQIIHDREIGDSMWEVFEENDLHEGQSQYTWWAERSQELINLTSFLALCFQQGIDMDGREHCKISTGTLGDALVENFETAEGKKFYIKIAANWILIAGPALYEALVKHPKSNYSKRFGPEKWGLLTAKFKDFWEEYEKVGDAEMALMARNAYEKMKELDSTSGSVS